VCPWNLNALKIAIAERNFGLVEEVDSIYSSDNSLLACGLLALFYKMEEEVLDLDVRCYFLGV